jgi:PAS domain S-box-containing protein
MHKILAYIMIAVVAIFLAATASIWTFEQIENAADSRNRVIVILKSANDLLSTLKDAETGQRGYLLTGDETFLQPYLIARDSLAAKQSNLYQITSIKESRNHLAKLTPLIAAKTNELARLIELRRNNQLSTVALEIGNGHGLNRSKRLMDSIRTEVNQLINIEEADFTRRESQFQTSMKRMFNVIILAGVLWGLFALAFIYLIYRQSKQKINNVLYIETQKLLDVQETSNKQLHLVNKALEGSQERLLVTLNSIGDAVICTDAQARVTLLNPLAQQLTGWTLAQANGHSVEEILHIINQDTRQPIIVPVNEALATGKIQMMTNHTVLIARDGSECIIADSCAPILDRDDKVVGAVLVFRDVSKSYAAKQLLRDHIARIQAIVNTAVDGIVTFHCSDGVIETANPAAERMFGYSTAEMLGKAFNMLIPELDQSKHENTLDDYAANDNLNASNQGHELIGLRKDNTSFALEIAISEMWLDNERYYTCILRDITQRKQADEILIKNNAELNEAKLLADKANLAKSDFLSNMSHELRTPLGTMLGFAQLVEAGTPALAPSQKKSIDQIIKAGWYLLDLINEILDLAVIESGESVISLEPVSLQKVMQECAAMIEPQALIRDIAVTFNKLDKPYFVNADHTRVKQILINLLSNAIKYNKVGGTVIIEHHLTSHDTIRVSVRDTGDGLSKELINQLFQPFNRLGQNAKAEVGTGIGLVVSKRLIELMHGKIGVESTQGKGSVFWIELNLVVSTALTSHALAEAEAEAEAEADLRTLLYVEDNPANLMLLEDIVAGRPDLRLLTAKDGKQGILLATAILPDVILMDINLLGMNGFEVLKILAKDVSTSQIPVIALSANAMPQDIEKGLQAGFFRYLTKPLKLNKFLDTLDEALQITKNQVKRNKAEQNKLTINKNKINKKVVSLIKQREKNRVTEEVK